MGEKKDLLPANKLFAWVRRQSMKVKVAMAVVAAIATVVALKFTVKDKSYFFIAAGAIHFVGIAVLVYKLIRKKTCSGLSLKTQELTALFLVTRLLCAFIIRAPIHIVLDIVTLVSTLWVIYMIRFKLKYTYMAELDKTPLLYVIVPTAIVAVLVHPLALKFRFDIRRIIWAFATYMKAIAVFPQLRMMQRAKFIEPFTAHYVFALGLARFLECAHWIIQVYESGGRYLYLVGTGHFWILAVLLAEIVQTFILADFCYYYVKSVMSDQLIMSLRSPV